MIFLYSLLLIIAFLFYILYNGPISYYLFYFLLILPVINLIGLIIAARKTKVTFKSDSRVYAKGHDSPFMLKLENTSPFMIPSAVIYVKYLNSLTDKGSVIKIITPIYPRNVQLLRLSATSDHYGSISATIEKIKVYDMLKLTRLRLSKRNFQHESVSVTFIPDYIALENDIMNYSDLGLESNEYSKYHPGDDPSEIFDIHEYAEGDKISRIHWKLTAKSDITYVKDFSLPISNSICLAANVSGKNTALSGLDMYDAVAEAFFGIGSYLSENSVPHNMVWYSEDSKRAKIVTASDIEEDTAVIREFVNSPVNSKDHSVLADYLDNREENVKYGHFIYITNSFDDNTAQLLISSDIALRYTVLYSGNNENVTAEALYDEIDIIEIRSSKIEQSINELML